MLPKHHLILGIIFTSIIYLLIPKIGYLGFLIILFSSVFIDVDHYLYYIIRKKDLNLKNAYKWFISNRNLYNNLPKYKKDKFYTAICWIHGIEIFLVLFALMYFSKIFLYIAIGFSFHIFIDMVYALLTNDEYHDFSAIYKFIKSRKLKHVEHA